jgi:hypothetical protein
MKREEVLEVMNSWLRGVENYWGDLDPEDIQAQGIIELALERYYNGAQ